MQETSRDCPIEGRAATRTNLFLAARLLSADAAHPARIRDLSPWGARVETFVVPEVGAELSLVRGRLSAPCQVAWSAGQFCGLSFSSPVSVHEWMAHRVGVERRRLTDLARIADGGGPDFAAAQIEVAKAARIALDLGRVNRLLATLREALAGDPEVVARHGVKLHNLGLAMQTLTALAEALRASTGEGAAAGAALEERRA